MSQIKKRAVNLYEEGHNCAQAVFAAFAEEIGLDRSTALRISSSFGGGLAQMREACGALTGMFMVMGYRFGYEDPKNKEAKLAFYEELRDMEAEFRAAFGTHNCGEMLRAAEDRGEPKPCAEAVGLAAEITERRIEKLAAHTAG